MESLEYNKGLYMPNSGHDRLTSPDASGLTFSPQAPTPQQMFGGAGLMKVTITEEEINKKLKDMKNNIRMNERKPNMEIDENRTQYLTPSPRSAFQSFRN
jgi:hypothetical protein